MNTYVARRVQQAVTELHRAKREYQDAREDLARLLGCFNAIQDKGDGDLVMAARNALGEGVLDGSVRLEEWDE